MALLDIAVLIIVLLSAVLAMVRGFSREVLSVGSWAAAAACAVSIAFWENDPLTNFVQGYIANETIAMITTIGVVFIASLIVVSLITMKISDFIIDSSIGALDRTLGFMFGAARGVLLFVVAVGMFNWLVPPEQHPDWIKNAKTKPFLDNTAIVLVEYLPTDIEEFVERGKEFIPADETAQPGASNSDAIGREIDQNADN